jgi:hypothetical protein
MSRLQTIQARQRSKLPQRQQLSKKVTRLQQIQQKGRQTSVTNNSQLAQEVSKKDFQNIRDSKDYERRYNALPESLKSSFEKPEDFKNRPDVKRIEADNIRIDAHNKEVNEWKVAQKLVDKGKGFVAHTSSLKKKVEAIMQDRDDAKIRARSRAIKRGNISLADVRASIPDASGMVIQKGGIGKITYEIPKTSSSTLQSKALPPIKKQVNISNLSKLQSNDNSRYTGIYNKNNIWDNRSDSRDISGRYVDYTTDSITNNNNQSRLTKKQERQIEKIKGVGREIGTQLKEFGKENVKGALKTQFESYIHRDIGVGLAQVKDSKVMKELNKRSAKIGSWDDAKVFGTTTGIAYGWSYAPIKYSLMGFYGNEARKQALLTVENPSDENIARTILMSAPLIPDSLKVTKNVYKKAGSKYVKPENVFSKICLEHHGQKSLCLVHLQILVRELFRDSRIVLGQPYHLLRVRRAVYTYVCLVRSMQELSSRLQRALLLGKDVQLAPLFWGRSLF